MLKWWHKLWCYDCRNWKADFVYGIALYKHTQWAKSWAHVQKQDIYCPVALHDFLEYSNSILYPVLD